MKNLLRELFRQAYVQMRRNSDASSQRRRLVQTGAALCEQLEARQLLAATGLQAFHRSGQTFITWNEDTAVSGEGFHVYRHSSPITSANLSQARKLTSKWGALDDQTSVHRLHGANSRRILSFRIWALHSERTRGCLSIQRHPVSRVPGTMQ